ncbi:PTS system, fructose-specific, IIB component/PTS system, fructose subfamily, IIC component [Thermanaerovibrio velox DSM 12556]|uniref:PTS system, fructose-specific, IIB component/PTS system, fructose subfamily, IIC component n=1 Tax=Thermanaerovibrio velox DSM 12556 TaxID=926567 RepID=H0UN47_9BACT|nr:PTS fructose transporter subunit IIBC [Thermanaerovibrio velox]EHM09326.1 PTS system, fructose-specific, IIB component/PTS system, fructose subfamily, IIC component [Thermanaerovibrio velox DSM 12556]
MRFVAVTSCPTGIAHTYMAAEKLSRAAQARGHEIKVETQGSIGVENRLTEEDIRLADGVIIAAGKGVDKERFRGKRLIEVSVAEGIKMAEGIIERLEKGEAPVFTGSLEGREEASETAVVKGKGMPVYQNLMNGVSYMIPFVVIGGLLIALSLAIGGKPTSKGLVIPEGSMWNTVLSVGVASFTFMVPILSGFIAYSIADRPGLAPGMVGGYVAANGAFYGSSAGTGFIGGIVAGFIAGYVVRYIKGIRVPKIIQPVMPILVIPVVSSLVVSSVFIFGIGKPIAGIMEGLTSWLNGMQDSSRVALAMVLGGMIAFDMGGPVNKVAFLFGSAMIGEGHPEIMGPIAVAICVPPLGLGVATMLARSRYSKEEVEAGKAAFAMGLVGITEGAIPFAAKDPVRVIPSIMVGSMCGAVVAMLSGVTDHVPHGGPIVAVLQAVDNVPMFFAAVAVGVAVTAVMVNFLKSR